MYGVQGGGQGGQECAGCRAGVGARCKGRRLGGGIVLHSPVVCLETHMKVRGCEGKRAGTGQGQGARVQRHRLCSGHQPRHGVCVTGCVGCSGPWCRERLPPPLLRCNQGGSTNQRMRVLRL